MSRKTTQSRWIKSVLRQAAVTEVQMPFARGARKSLSERRSEHEIAPARRVAAS
ncbi:hypothetical protein [Thioclava indica]|uniref:Uncharacterized protein n=1 Tax=Thioclava indica TaxID=1353528 RepID=A0A074KHA0_9RHOB|nr:hypothetical protein [Thioclava indica]KEO60962.1 hypothetical protein DT23_11270 [Thioclava indica]